MKGRCIFTLMFVIFVGAAAAPSRRRPNVIFILSDDVGWADTSFNREPSHVNFTQGIHTPHLDTLAKQGVRLTKHHVHSTCTPSRASLMTGRYSSNTGLVFAMLPGSIAGLPPDMLTLPQVMRKQGYRAHMVGKWHVGHAQWKQTPVGRGFETHVGNYLWSMEYWNKEMWELPWSHFAIDWVRAHENGTYEHYAEPKHTTQVLTEEAIRVIHEHAAETKQKHGDDSTAAEPLLLYLAYTAAHAPLEPMPQDEEACTHLKHEWRRKFCGLMQGLDRGVRDVVDAAKRQLGEDTVIVFTSDNGGAPWFGGNNEPLRSGKTSPFQGGVQVPCFALDLSTDGFFLGRGGRTFDGLAHMSDWLPTFAKMAGTDEATIAAMSLDGHDLGHALRDGGHVSPRKSVLLEMWYASRGEFLFPEDVGAYRTDRWKLIESRGMRDAHWYREPTEDVLLSSDTSWVTASAEWLLRFLEGFTTAGKFDSVRDLAVHIGIHAMFRGSATDSQGDNVELYDLDVDPSERHNVAASHPDVVAKLRHEMYEIRDARPEQAKFWMTIDRDLHWDDTLQTGDCSLNPAILPANCRFTHPWVADDADITKVTEALIHGAAAWPFVRSTLVQIARVTTIPTLVIVVIWKMTRRIMA